MFDSELAGESEMGSVTERADFCSFEKMNDQWKIGLLRLKQHHLRWRPGLGKKFPTTVSPTNLTSPSGPTSPTTTTIHGDIHKYAMVTPWQLMAINASEEEPEVGNIVCIE